MKPMLLSLVLIILSFSTHQDLYAQKADDAAIRQMIRRFQNDIRGPYRDIRWFCDDGSVIPPKESCPTGGVQRARYKEEVIALGKSNHLFLGQILSTTPFADFWDADHYNSRLKQYQLEKYLRAVDNGWILRKGQYYRGAFQAEDESAWGIAFFHWLLSNDAPIQQQFFLLRQALRDIPHRGDDNRTQAVRAISREISDDYEPFLNLRVKIHGQPEASDLTKVRAFKEQHRARLTPEMLAKMDKLIAHMTFVYQPVDLTDLNKYIKVLPAHAPIVPLLNSYVASYSTDNPNPGRAAATAEMIWLIRTHLASTEDSRARLALLDASLQLEQILIRELPDWETRTFQDLLDKICYLGMAAAGGGYLEIWEWEMVKDRLIISPDRQQLSLPECYHFLEAARGTVDWGTSMTRGVYQDVVNLYGGFEPLAYGFYDDQVRSSLLLGLGEAVSQLDQFLSVQAGWRNQVMGLSNQAQVRGLNPGYALGELIIVSGTPEDLEIARDKIYLFDWPPADLKPVAGIATATEGNLVSHVQLLARNLGIPNAVFSSENIRELQPYAGQRVFYAVSNQGTVLMKPESQMTPEERQLFALKQRKQEKVFIPVDNILLDQKDIINLRDIDAGASGKLCGPKAANLGQLKRLFPHQVVEGLVIPFGIFREHLDQPMPGQAFTYWQYLNRLFTKADQQRSQGIPEPVVEGEVLSGLDTLRTAIMAMELNPDFVAQLKKSFPEVLGDEIGKVPVFLRSDTNMEDLKDFTGAGLNLTLFNVLAPEKILQGIKDVWASPYTERSYQWRQQYLLNPENVYPSILIIPSVNVDYSGVMITTGLTSGDPRDLTIAFSRGAGGAVEGQAAETYLLTHAGENRLLSPAREPAYRTLPPTGGTLTRLATFETPILNATNLYDLRLLSEEIQRRFPGDGNGPFDVELGFLDDQIWLFQIRPFVENKRARASTYLESITPRAPANKMIRLSLELQP